MTSESAASQIDILCFPPSQTLGLSLGAKKFFSSFTLTRTSGLAAGTEGILAGEDSPGSATEFLTLLR